jgi:hypothetical protein
MSDKKINQLDVNKVLQRIVSPSVFDKIVKEVDAKEIPTQYVERIVVFYKDGSVVELSGTEITQPVPVNRNGNWKDTEDPYQTMKEVKIFVNTDRLEKDINILVGQYLDGKC